MPPNGKAGACHERSNLIRVPDLLAKQLAKSECVIGQAEQPPGAKHPRNLLKAPFLVSPMMKRYAAEDDVG